VCRSKHVEPSINFGIINSITNLHLVGISIESLNYRTLQVKLSHLAPLEFGLNNTARQMCVPHITANAVKSYSDSLQAGQSGNGIPVGTGSSAPVQTGPGFHPTSYRMATGSFPGLKGPERDVDTHHHLAPKLKKE
jgi:hypothetical protein